MIYADLHIHIGRSLDGKPVKITAAASLTLPNIISEARDIKGLSLVGIVDAHSTGVRQDFVSLLEQGALIPLSGGGYRAGNLTIIPGTEVELQLGSGSAHLLAYFPDLEQVEKYRQVIQPYVKNWQLSSQKAFISILDWLEAVHVAEGIWLPAHAFTPHKGIYGNCCARLSKVLPEFPLGLEIGLSADRRMARGLSELDEVVLFSNSDAHSLPNIAREYNKLKLSEPSFNGLKELVFRQRGQLISNYGLMPEVGKYHRTYCLVCEQVIDSEPPIFNCPQCGSKHVVAGVMDRLLSIADRTLEDLPGKYIYQIPLRIIPGVGPKTIDKLLQAFGTEMAILHEASAEDIVKVAGEKTAEWILRSRRGEFKIKAGGGGEFGHIVDILS